MTRKSSGNAIHLFSQSGQSVAENRGINLVLVDPLNKIAGLISIVNRALILQDTSYLSTS